MMFLFACGDLELDNPLDPENPDYVEPETTILTGPAEGDTVHNSSVTFTWEGNEQTIEYSYSINNSLLHQDNLVLSIFQ